MNEINYKKKYNELLIPEIVFLLTKIHEFKGKQALFIEAHVDELEHLTESSCIQNIEAFSQIEKIVISDERLKLLALDKTMPKNQKEFEIAGYREVLNMIHSSYEHIPIKSSVILQLHRDLYKFNSVSIGGKYKTIDTVTKEDFYEVLETGFITMSGLEISEMIEELCHRFEEIFKDEIIDPLLIIPMFILDFLCLYPFSDGNGRISRLLTLLLLYRSGYMVGKYVSIEKLIESSKDNYYEALQQSLKLWQEGKNNYEPFVRYMLNIIVSAYQQFYDRANFLIMNDLSKPEKVREVIKETKGTITKTEIMKKCPNISQVTVQRALAELLANDEIIKIGGGRYTEYKWKKSKGDN